MRMESAETIVVGVGDHAVELIASSASGSSADGVISEEITPLLKQAEKPKINIFSVSYPRTKSRDQVRIIAEAEISPFTQFFVWAWNGSRYSGLLCMALSSTIYFSMEVFSNVFAGQSLPLFETAFTRCTIILILSYFWLRRSGLPMLGPAHIRTLLFLRALSGTLSLLSFIYCVQRLPLSQAIALSFSTPIMASIAASIILHERLKIADIGVLACSFFGVLFIFRPMFTVQGGSDKAGDASDIYLGRHHHIYAVLIGLFSSITGGISYCLTKAGVKASDQPLVTVFSFAALASPITGLCTFAFQDFVLPGFYSFLLMIILSVLAFFAEVFLARGLQLEKTGKVANVQYVEAVLFQLWGLSTSRMSPSLSRLFGCLLIFISVGCTMYIGPDKETE